MISDAARQVFNLLAERSFRLAAAESCTSGMISIAITDIPGASKVFWGSLVCYSNEAKARVLGVDEGLLKRSGAASEDAAIAMAEGVLATSGADFAVAATGVAGPDGDGTGLPVGTVRFAVARRGEGRATVVITASKFYGGDRTAVRDEATEDALLLVAACIRESEKTPFAPDRLLP